LPFYNGNFIGWSGQWQLDWDIKRQLDDIDKVMNYFDGMSEYTRMSEAIEKAFVNNQSRKIKSTYFEVTFYKKGTVHFRFLNKDILRRFNVTACKCKNMLPEDYGRKEYKTYSNIVDTFEDKKTYEKNITEERCLFRVKDRIQIACDLPN